MWIDKKMAQECYKATKIFLNAEEENAYKYLKTECVRYAAISEIRKIEEEVRDFLQKGEKSITEYDFIMVRTVSQALDYCVSSTSHIEAACTRWKSVQAGFEAALSTLPAIW